MAKLYDTSKDAGRSGFQAIKKIRGLQVSLDVVPPPLSWNSEDWLAQLNLEDVSILEMLPGEDPPELRDNKFSITWSYGLTKSQIDAGKHPPAKANWMKFVVPSAEALGKPAVSSLNGEYVTLARKEFVSFTPNKKDPETKKELVDQDGKHIPGEPVMTNIFVYVADETSGSETVDDYIRGKIIGLNQRAATRMLLTDIKAKQYPKYKELLNSGELADELGLVLVGEGDQAKFSEP